MNPKELTLSLIKDHIKHTRLISGLSATGLNAEDFSLNLGNTVFEVMGLEDSDERFSQYLTIIEKVVRLGETEWLNKVEPLANEAYTLLLRWK